jgi:hypothetical protein
MLPDAFAGQGNNLCFPLLLLLLLLLSCHPAGSQASWQSFVTIDGYDYDISAFAKQHPGGGVIKHYAGMDASAAFTEFHRWGGHGSCIKALLVLQVLWWHASTS